MVILQDPSFMGLELENNLEVNIESECTEALRPIFRRHNLFYGRRTCCAGQCERYREHGFSRMMMTLREYISKLTDYSETGKEFFEPSSL